MSATIDTLSSTAYNSCIGLYGTQLLTSNYNGPVMCIRNDITNKFANVFADGNNNLSVYTDNSGTGVSLSNWLTLSDTQTCRLLLHFDSNFTDSSTYSNASYSNGSPSFCNVSKFGTYSLYTSASNYIYYPNAINFVFGSKDFTIEFWFNPGSSNLGSRGTQQIIGNCMNNWTYFNWRIGTNGTNMIFQLNNFSLTLTGSTNVSGYANTWYHYALSRRNGYFYQFINGNSDGSLYTSNVSIDSDHVSSLAIGSSGNGTAATECFTGLLDEVRIFIGQGLYTSNFTPTSSAYTIGNNYVANAYIAVLYNQSSNSDLNLINSNNNTTQPIYNQTSNTIVFTGTSNSSMFYSSLANEKAPFTIGNTTFVYNNLSVSSITNNTSWIGSDMLFGADRSGVTNDFGITATSNGTGWALSIGTGATSSGDTFLSNMSGLSFNTPYNLAVSFAIVSGSNALNVNYYNGSTLFRALSNATNNSNLICGTPAIIGYRINCSFKYFQIYNSALSSSDVSIATGLVTSSFSYTNLSLSNKLLIDTMSISGYTSLAACYSTTQLVNNYYGPLFRITNSNYTISTNVYSCSNVLYTLPNGKGTQLVNWCYSNTAPFYVSTFLDQSGNFNHLTTPSVYNYPLFDVVTSELVFNSNNINVTPPTSNVSFLQVQPGILPASIGKYTFASTFRPKCYEGGQSIVAQGYASNYSGSTSGTFCHLYYYSLGYARLNTEIFGMWNGYSDKYFNMIKSDGYYNSTLRVNTNKNFQNINMIINGTLFNSTGNPGIGDIRNMNLIGGTASSLSIGLNTVSGAIQNYYYGRLTNVVVFSSYLSSSDTQIINKPVSTTASFKNIITQTSNISVSSLKSIGQFPLPIGCAFRFDAFDTNNMMFSEIGTGILQMFYDTSGNKCHLTTNFGVPTYLPNCLNGKPGVYFNSSRMNSLPFYNSSNLTIFAVVAINSFSSNGILFGHFTDSNNMNSNVTLKASSTNTSVLNWHSGNTSNGGANLTWYSYVPTLIVGSVTNGSNMSMTMYPHGLSVTSNSSVLSSSTIIFNSSNYIYIGGSDSNSPNTGSFVLSELIGFYQNLSGSNTSNVVNSLLTKWNIAPSGYSVSSQTSFSSVFNTPVSTSLSMYQLQQKNNKSLFSYANLLSFYFDTAGITGSSQPTLSQLQTSYSNFSTSNQGWWINNCYSQLLAIDTGIQYFKVPSSGKYRIVAAGAAGGSSGSYTGGSGVIVSTVLNLTENQTLKILIGQAGNNGTASLGGGGGGATFVATNTNFPILVAGGGGGAGTTFTGSNATNLASYAYVNSGNGGQAGAGFTGSGFYTTQTDRQTLYSFVSGGYSITSYSTSGGFGCAGGTNGTGGGGGGGLLRHH